MTQTQYNSLYLKAKKELANLTADTLKKIRSVYISESKKVADEILKYKEKGLSNLTTDSLQNIYNQLQESAKKISDKLEDLLYTGIDKSSGNIAGIDEKYLIDLIGLTDGKLTKTGIENMFLMVNENAVKSMVARIYQDGYTFSERVWNVGKDYQNQLKDIISGGIASGRDVIDIAADLNGYVKEGKQKLITRWGDFTEDSPGWMKRIRKDVYYPSLRLVRSELYSSLQDATKLSGQFNPACNGLYDWIRTNQTDWRCDCPELEAGSPYTADNIPDYPHPSCLCRIQPRLRDRGEFSDDMVAWANGEDVDYIDDWYNEFYSQVE